MWKVVHMIILIVLVMREPGLEPRLGRAGAQKTELRLENGLGIFA